MKKANDSRIYLNTTRWTILSYRARQRERNQYGFIPLWAMTMTSNWPRGVPFSLKCHIPLSGSSLLIQHGLTTFTNRLCKESKYIIYFTSQKVTKKTLATTTSSSNESARDLMPLTAMYLGGDEGGNCEKLPPTSSSPTAPFHSRTSPFSNHPSTYWINRESSAVKNWAAWSKTSPCGSTNLVPSLPPNPCIPCSSHIKTTKESLTNLCPLQQLICFNYNNKDT